MKIVAMMSGAANTGKSASAVTLGTKMALRGQKVCIIDLDRQRTSTFYLDSEVDPYEPGQLYIGDVLLRRPKAIASDGSKREARLVDAIQETAVENLFVVACHTNIMNDVIELTRLNGAKRLAKELKALEGYFDVVILDCPGELNIIAVAAIVAATDIILCISPTIKHVDVDELWKLVDSMRDDNDTVAAITAVIPCIVPSSRKGVFYQQVLKAVLTNERFRDLATPTVREQHFEPTAYGHQTPLPILYPKSDVNLDYDKVLTDLDSRGITSLPIAA